MEFIVGTQDAIAQSRVMIAKALCQQAYCTREINASAEPVPDTKPFLEVMYTLCDIAAASMPTPRTSRRSPVVAAGGARRIARAILAL
jgi:hypothetical protein